MAHDDAVATISVEVVFSPRPGQVQRVELTLPSGATVAQAIARSGLQAPADLCVGVWGRVCTATQRLRDRDRVEIYRPLLVDPKEARRQRYRSHRAAQKR